MKTKVSGAWKDGIPHVKVAGVWKKAIAEWVKVSGVWKKVAYAIMHASFSSDMRKIGTSTYRHQYSPINISSVDRKVPSDYPITGVDYLAKRAGSNSYSSNVIFTFSDGAERDRLYNAIRAKTATIQVHGESGGPYKPHPYTFGSTELSAYKQGSTGVKFIVASKYARRAYGAFKVIFDEGGGVAYFKVDYKD